MGRSQLRPGKIDPQKNQLGNFSHLRFKQAQPKMCHSPKVEDKVENQLFTSWTNTFNAGAKLAYKLPLNLACLIFFLKKMSENMAPRSEKIIFNFVLNFRRVTHFWLCLLETQV